MDLEKGYMFDHLVSAMIKSDKFDAYLNSEIELKKAQQRILQDL